MRLTRNRPSSHFALQLKAALVHRRIYAFGVHVIFLLIAEWLWARCVQAFVVLTVSS